MALLVTSQSLFIKNPKLPTFSSSPTKTNLSLNHVRFSHLPSPKRFDVLLRRTQFHASPSPKPRVSATSTISPPDSPNRSPYLLLSDSTRTVTTIFSLAISLSKLFLGTIQAVSEKIKILCVNPTPDELAKIESMRRSVVCTVGPLFFAALRDRPSGYLNTPLTVVAAGMAKWLDIYSGVLMVRVLLSWFPNIPWDRQPLSAIRDLCDPYLNLFRNIIPPVFDTLDVSPLLAFAVLGTLGSILNNSRGSY
eukprot:TRINITY_DN22868_c0_g1_i1.p1 TRINITY_DN22868_c0_g1~~TRINITY_DN22868_c0_g1_i1.p1  ORF type:complete len:250 (-),score=14.38 TRINITY_DN22868_c0_g1_i1:239-988(-)